MEGMTISEMAKALKLPRRTIEMRVFRGGFKPISQEALYSPDVFEAIKVVPGRGRPAKKPEAPARAAKPGKAAKNGKK
jgi:hypothetical protein